MLIGIIGKKEVGKSTLASYITTNFNAQEYSFAGPLKEIAHIFGFEKKVLYGDAKLKESINKKLGLSAREFLQKFGTEIMRDYFPKVLPNYNLGESGIIWIKLFENFLENNNDKVIIVSDVRFPDEADAIKRNGGVLLKLTRDTKDNEFSKHSSEQSIDTLPFDILIENNNTKEELYTKTINTLKKLPNNKIF